MARWVLGRGCNLEVDDRGALPINRRLHRRSADLARQQIRVALMHYIMVIGPMDQSFVGPFKTKEDAHRWTHNKPGNFDYYILSYSQLMDNFADYGQSAIESPNTWH